ncbi:MAG: hypothetical protein QNJ15_01025 [Erythrobacter sp.]|nr:hypothetical protein [Erythrobacter sp.]
MVRFSAIRHWLLKVMNARPAGETDMDQSALVRAAMLAEAISGRESEGLDTTLRQLHAIAPLTQPAALKAVAELESLGLVQIKENLHDKLDSQVTSTDKLRRNLERGFRCNAA